MDFIFKWCTPRNLLLSAGVAAGLVFAVPRLQPYPRQWVRAWLYPPQKGTTPGGDEIMRLALQRDAAAVTRRHQEVLALLAQAQADGFEIGALLREADVALQLNTPRYRRQALSLLAQVQAAVPRRKVQYIPSGTGADEAESIPRDLPGRRVGGGRR